MVRRDNLAGAADESCLQSQSSWTDRQSGILKVARVIRATGKEVRYFGRYDTLVLQPQLFKCARGRILGKFEFNALGPTNHVRLTLKIIFEICVQIGPLVRVVGRCKALLRSVYTLKFVSQKHPVRLRCHSYDASQCNQSSLNNSHSIILTQSLPRKIRHRSRTVKIPVPRLRR